MSLTAGRFEGTMSALLGSKRFRPSLRFVVVAVRQAITRLDA
jgi:hypothetical protein